MAPDLLLDPESLLLYRQAGGVGRAHALQVQAVAAVIYNGERVWRGDFTNEAVLTRNSACQGCC